MIITPIERVMRLIDDFPQMDECDHSIVGSTDYIDQIADADVASGGIRVPVVSFCDQYERNGLAIRLIVNDVQSNTEVDRGVFAVFKRYTVGSLFVVCRSHKIHNDVVSGHALGLFNNIVHANTALDDTGYRILACMLDAHNSGEAYVTDDGMYKVRFVANFPTN